MIERRESDESARLSALQEAACIGIADIDAGRFRIFETPDVLDRHLSALASEVINAA